MIHGEEVSCRREVGMMSDIPENAPCRGVGVLLKVLKKGCYFRFKKLPVQDKVRILWEF